MSAIRIDGATRLYGIVGNPVAQVRSPERFCELFVNAHMNAVMLPIQVLPDHFDVALPALMNLGNLDGLLVTVPYKAQAVRFADRLGVTASQIGALNALRREADGTWTGDMFDGDGFVRGAQRKGYTLQGRRGAIFGAGGAGSAIGFALAAAGVESLCIIDPQRQRAAELVDALRRSFPNGHFEIAYSVPAAANMVINASTVGMNSGDGMPGKIDALGSETLVGDVIVSTEPTSLIAFATRRGCEFVNGREMHSGQSEALMSFFGQR